MSAPTNTELAIRIVNLRRALETANRQLQRVHVSNGGQGTLFLVGVDENAMPTFREGRKFWAEVNRIAEGKEER